MGIRLQWKRGKQPSQWQCHNEALQTFRDRLLMATFAAVILDYDDAAVDCRHLLRVSREDLIAQLVRLLKGGGRIASRPGERAFVRVTFAPIFRSIDHRSFWEIR